MRQNAVLQVSICVAASLIIGAPRVASAQQTGEATATMPRWDVSGGVGIHYLSHQEFAPDESWWETKAQLRAQAGFYVTQHLKLELLVAGPTRYDLYEEERIPVAGLPGGGWAFTDRTLTVVTTSPAVTYQFFENVFAHPFVSAGVDVHIADDHRLREASTSVVNRISYSVPAIDTRRTLVLARPFFAVGFKSYFSDRVFVRPEAHAAFSSGGASQVGLRLDVGVDF